MGDVVHGSKAAYPPYSWPNALGLKDKETDREARRRFSGPADVIWKSEAWEYAEILRSCQKEREMMCLYLETLILMLELLKKRLFWMKWARRQVHHPQRAPYMDSILSSRLILIRVPCVSAADINALSSLSVIADIVCWSSESALTEWRLSFNDARTHRECPIHHMIQNQAFEASAVIKTAPAVCVCVHG